MSDSANGPYLVTGAGGFVGRYLVSRLLAATSGEVIAAVNATGVDEATWGGAQTLRVARLDLRDAPAVAELVTSTRPIGIFHLAARANPSDSVRDPATTLDDNLRMQVNLFEATRGAGLIESCRVLVVGSSEQYGRIGADENPIAESAPFRPETPYAVSKIGQELLAQQYHRRYGAPTIVARAFNHTGPGQSDRYVVSAWARQVAEIELGRRARVTHGNLAVWRDLSDVRDVVEAYWRLMRFGEPGQVYNVGSGRSAQIGDIMGWLQAAAQRPIDPTLDPDLTRRREINEVRASINKIFRLTGWRPLIPLEQTVRDTLDWWRTRLTSH